jgi:hypothetical protein
VLGARLYEHSTNFGLWNVKVGKLVQRTGAGMIMDQPGPAHVPVVLEIREQR